MSNNSENVTKFQLSLNNEFQQSELYPFFGFVNIKEKEYYCDVAVIISASDDIEIPKVIDFIKDYIPTQLSEADSDSMLGKFKIVNEKIAEVLSDTLEKDSFINVQLAYVLFSGEYFYLSLDDDFDLVISRGSKQIDLRKDYKGTLDGSGVLENGDNIELVYQGVVVMRWSQDVDVYIPEVETKYVSESIHEENVQEKDNYTLPQDDEVNELRFEDNEDNIESEEQDHEKNYSVEEQEPSSRVSFKERLNPALSKSKDVYKKVSPNIIKGIKAGARYVGEAFSYLFSFIFRGKRRGGLSKALPNKKKGFLIISAIIFLVILLAFFIKNTNEDNMRKQQEQSYREQVTKVGNDIKQAESLNNIAIGDRVFNTTVSGLRSEIDAVNTNSLKDKLNLGSDISALYARVNNLQDKVDGVIDRVDEASVISRFEGFISNPGPSSMDYREGKLYFTDINNNKVYQVDVATRSSAVSIVGQTEGLGRPVSLQFSKSKLLVLDNNNGIMSVDVSAKTTKKVAGYDTLTPTCTEIKTFYDTTGTDNFYLLQPAEKQIQRVPGLGNGNFAVAGKYNPAGFDDNIVDFTIIGGQVYTINNTGGVNKYNRVSATKTDKVPFTLPTLDVPIGDGARIVGMAPRDVGDVFFIIADPVNNRILVFNNKDASGNATFVGQYKPKDGSPFDFKTIKSIVLDESTGQPVLYTVSPFGILQINIKSSL